MPETRTRWRRFCDWCTKARRSLSFRVIAFSSIWAIIALLVIATVISTLFRQVSQRGFDTVLSAHLFNLIASVSASDRGELVGVPNLGDLRFSRPNSGWYWSVEPVSDTLSRPLRSASLTGPVPVPSSDEVPFDDTYQRAYLTTGPADHEIQVLEAEIVLGEGDRIARFRVMGNVSELESEISRFSRRLMSYLGLFGLGMVGINVLAILLALGPLGNIRGALAKIREGQAEKLSGPFPAEIEPLAHETNALIESNRRIIERSRTQVGNLAHSLKTPLAVVTNEARQLGGDRGRLIEGQASAMQNQIDHYLKRARAAAQQGTLAQRTQVNETLNRLLRAFRKISPETHVDQRMPEGAVIFAGEREDFEEICGNLLENAVKWSSGHIRVEVVEAGSTFLLCIEDDGPGIPEEQARQALKRGRRLDESKPGTGLGLAIVADLVEEYKGTIALERSRLGGLRAVVTLPVA
ncbi:ATP-binding protein [Nitratireductor basaltis]|uniref:histidine kinase n=1 Tax=Nitratireductor basaltis TaxID=472175 RepID=A0A084UCF2_9HYPH|nr:ATP-binding protein [Nitratireductor basaltis]KFB10638.1 Periplasmic sensor signal transduction histidine kinase precursor [Nitratireductor basaltis]